MKKYLLATAFTLLTATTSFADIMYTHRDKDSKGFFAYQYTYGQFGTGDGIYGEHDVLENKIPDGDRLSITYRYEDGVLDMEGNNPGERYKVATNIKHIGLKYLKSFHSKFRAGVQVTVADRDPYSEYNGVSYRVMPVAEWDATEFLTFRYLSETDIIPRGSITDENKLKGLSGKYENSREHAIYYRINLDKMLKGAIARTGVLKNVELEVKRAQGLSGPVDERPWTNEKFMYFTLPNDIMLYVSSTVAYKTMGIIYKY